jgi:hypothetical protein
MAGEHVQEKIEAAGEEAKQAIENERANTEEVVLAAKAQAEEAARTAATIAEAAVMGEHANNVNRAHERISEWQGHLDQVKSEQSLLREEFTRMREILAPKQAPVAAEIVATPPVGSIQPVKVTPVISAATSPDTIAPGAVEGARQEALTAPRKPKTRWL